MGRFACTHKVSEIASAWGAVANVQDGQGQLELGFAPEDMAEAEGKDDDQADRQAQTCVWGSHNIQRLLLRAIVSSDPCDALACACRPISKAMRCLT